MQNAAPHLQLRSPAWHFQPPSWNIPAVNAASMDGLAHLPSTRELVDSLLTELAAFKLSAAGTNLHGLEPSRTQTAIQDKQSQNSFSRLPGSELTRVKPIMLTLHCLFPNDLLPALDILDRGLVRRFVRADNVDTMITVSGHEQTVTTEDQSTLQDSGSCVDPIPPIEDMFLVTSATAASPYSAATPSTSTTYEQVKGYEVRLHAWNCTCPTFALSAFRDLTLRLDSSAERHSCTEMLHDQGPVVYPFGGTLNCATDRDSPPVCKHILACVLFARCPGLFGAEGGGKRVVSMEELAGWCAGWGG